jgi:alkanesulfonate monooxygenase
MASDEVDFIGFVGAQYGSETHPASGPVIDRDYIRAVVQAQEYGGFDRFLVAFHSTSPDSLLLAQYAASVTERINLMVAHRPGFTAPTVAARQFATLDHLTNGRAGIHIITGGNDAELAQDGDALTKDERYARTSEYLDVIKASWTSAAPFDYDGVYYRVTGAFSNVKPVQTPHLPVYFGGSSEAAIAVAGKHADTYALWGETAAQVRDTIARVRASAARHGREDHVRFSLSFRPIRRMLRGHGRRRSWRAPGRSGQPAGSVPPPRRQTRARAVCWPRPRKAPVPRAASTPPLRPRPAHRATRPRSSVRPIR